MQIEDYSYQKNIYQPLGGKANKPDMILDANWEMLNKKALMQLDSPYHHQLLSIFPRRKPLKNSWLSFRGCMKSPPYQIKYFFMKRLFHMKMIEDGTVEENLNEFNIVTSQLNSIGINFDDKVRALLIISSLQES